VFIIAHMRSQLGYWNEKYMQNFCSEETRQQIRIYVIIIIRKQAVNMRNGLNLLRI
jgi:hypothetical protein